MGFINQFITRGHHINYMNHSTQIDPKWMSDSGVIPSYYWLIPSPQSSKPSWKHWFTIAFRVAKLWDIFILVFLLYWHILAIIYIYIHTHTHSHFRTVMSFFHGQPPLVKIPSHNLQSRKSTWVCLKMGYRVYIYTSKWLCIWIGNMIAIQWNENRYLQICCTILLLVLSREFSGMIHNNYQ